MIVAKTPDSLIEQILLLGRDPELTYKDISLAVDGVLDYKGVWRVLHGRDRKGVRRDIPRRTHEPKIKISDEIIEKVLLLGQDLRLSLEDIGRITGVSHYAHGIITGKYRKNVRPDLPRREVIPAQTPDFLVKKVLSLGQNPEATAKEIELSTGVPLATVFAILNGSVHKGLYPELSRRKIATPHQGVRPTAKLEKMRQKAFDLLGQGIGPKIIAKKLGKSSGCIMGLLGFGGKPYIRSHCTCCKLPRAEGHTPDCVVGKWLSRNDTSKKDALERQAKEIRDYDQYAQECSQRSKAKTRMKKEKFMAPAKHKTTWNAKAVAQVNKLQAEGWEVFRVTNSRRPTYTADGRCLMNRYDVKLVTIANGRHAGDVAWSTWAIRLKSNPNQPTV